ncbi:Monodictyphenone cluster transcription factor [Colletotrichum siamense]|uniref:Monodictyphenone cluster transcription factor n=1 Tax=Colletotrichum siamense TaxID=690259 RepID=UPI001872881F|nr:Monodictyphenone cluster transcription factor [Colletotrichum siamense]KAF4812765.1 Monodictyphenone cluster transcription factor [Colletotrichum siamense]KAF5486700.1 Monodictyphenone cluster transcription factor [Colletotrichum siamense]
MSSSSKPRQPRLRASCDGCFLAKVKCSKARPICSRCLACGLECRYSPSSRAGKPKSDNSAPSHANTVHMDMTDLSPIMDEKNMMFAQHPGAGMYKMENGWHTPTSMEGAMTRNPSISSGLALLGVDDATPRDHQDPTADMYGGAMPWTPPTDFSAAPYPDMTMATAHMAPHHHHGRSQSMDMAMAAHMTPWGDAAAQHDGMMQYQAMPTPNSMAAAAYFPSPSTTPNMRPAVRHKSSNSGGGGSCTCFTVCLQSLQALHNASSPSAPPFDLVLSLNRKAVEGCASMLSCNRCMSRSGTHTAAMLLATVIGKITSFYKNASHTYFENGSGGGSMMGGMGSSSVAAAMNQLNSPGAVAVGGLGVSLGAYTLGGEDGRWLELEILNRELRKLEEVYAQFREVCADLSEDPEVSKAMIGYLGHNLGTTLEVVSHRKGDMSYA